MPTEIQDQMNQVQEPMDNNMTDAEQWDAFASSPVLYLVAFAFAMLFLAFTINHFFRKRKARKAARKAAREDDRLTRNQEYILAFARPTPASSVPIALYTRSLQQRRERRTSRQGLPSSTQSQSVNIQVAPSRAEEAAVNVHVVQNGGSVVLPASVVLARRSSVMQATHTPTYLPPVYRPGDRGLAKTQANESTETLPLYRTPSPPPEYKR